MKRAFRWMIPAGGLGACARLLPGFAIFWSRAVSLPTLRLLSLFADALPFPLAECLAAGAALWIAAGLGRRHFLRRLARVFALFAAAYFALWYPLYFLPAPRPQASVRQVHALSGLLIDTLNAAPPDFSISGPLPAKFARLPLWMDALGASGVCAFFSGEALIAPGLPEASLPFIAVHERMHLLGFADEGAANIAAWEECMARGGGYAASARVWALRYAMGILRRQAPGLYQDCLARMGPHTLRFFREAGGAHVPVPSPLQPLLHLLGIARPTENYEMLALRLAADMPE